MQAEAQFWKRSEGYRLGPTDQLLGFDCGGQQWVLESCFPTGTLRFAILQHATSQRAPLRAMQSADNNSKNGSRHDSVATDIQITGSEPFRAIVAVSWYTV